MAIIDDAGAVDDIERFPHIMVRDENADAPVAKLPHQIADVGNGDGVDPGERLVEQDDGRGCRKRPSYFHPPPLAPRQRHRRGLAQTLDMEIAKQLVQPRLTISLAGAVRTAPLRPRWSSSMPSRRSNSWMPLLSAGCDRFSRSAALRMLPLSSIAITCRNKRLCSGAAVMPESPSYQAQPRRIPERQNGKASCRGRAVQSW